MCKNYICIHANIENLVCIKANTHQRLANLGSNVLKSGSNGMPPTGMTPLILDVLEEAFEFQVLTIGVVQLECDIGEIEGIT